MAIAFPPFRSMSPQEEEGRYGARKETIFSEEIDIPATPENERQRNISRITGQIIHTRLIEVLEESVDVHDTYNLLRPVSMDYCECPALEIPNLVSRVNKLTGKKIKKSSDIKVFTQDVLRAIHMLTPKELLNGFSDVELAMISFSMRSGFSHELLDTYIQHRFYLLHNMQLFFWRHPTDKRLIDWNATIELLQMALRFQYPPFDVRLEASGNYFGGYSRILGSDVFMEGGFAYHFMLEGERVLTLSYEYDIDGQIRIRQIQGAPGKRRELSKIGKYPDDILRAFLEQFSDKTVMLVTGDKAVESVLSSFGEREDRLTRFIRQDIQRVHGFYDRIFEGIQVSESVDGFRKISLKQSS